MGRTAWLAILAACSTGGGAPPDAPRDDRIVALHKAVGGAIARVGSDLALITARGQTRWRRALPADRSYHDEHGMLVDGTAAFLTYQSAIGAGVAAYDVATGEERWAVDEEWPFCDQPPRPRLLALDERGLVAVFAVDGDAAGLVLVIDPEDGALRSHQVVDRAALARATEDVTWRCGDAKGCAHHDGATYLWSGSQITRVVGDVAAPFAEIPDTGVEPTALLVAGIGYLAAQQGDRLWLIDLDEAAVTPLDEGVARLVLVGGEILVRYAVDDELGRFMHRACDGLSGELMGEPRISVDRSWLPERLDDATLRARYHEAGLWTITPEGKAQVVRPF